MESNIHKLTKKAVFLADDAHHSYTERGHNSVIDNAFEPNEYACLKLYVHTYGSTSSDAITALNNNQIFMLYSGHGNYQEIVNPKIKRKDLYHLSNSVFPFGFSFACETNKFDEDECFGETWLRGDNGGVTYYGASTISFYGPDKKLEKKIFNKAWHNENTEQIGPIVQLGMQKLLNNFITSTGRKKRYVEMYNLMGDPSISTTGIGCIPDYVFTNDEDFHSGDKITYHASNTIVAANGNATFTVESGANVTLISGESIIIKNGFTSKPVFKAYIEPCIDGSEEDIKLSNKNEYLTNQQTQFDKTKITKALNVKAFPNPFKTIFYIEYFLNGKSDIHIKVYNLLGEEFFSKNITNQLNGNHILEIDGNNFEKGIYIVKMQTNQFKKTLFILKLEK